MTADRFFDLLPAVVRARDAGRGHPLRDLLRVLGAEADLLEGDIRSLYDDLFVETCAPWAIPYLGDLVGFRPAAGLVPRRAVADTIRHRRRKGTRAVLEDLVPAVSGWPAVVCDGPDAPGCGGAVADRVTVRVWRLPSWPLTHVRPFRLRRRTNSYAVAVLGNDAPLFTGTSGAPRPLTVDALRADLAGHYGEDADVCLYEDGVPIPAERIRVRELSAWRPEAIGQEVALDPERGRVMFPERYELGTVTVSSYQGFPAALGGGEYPRPAPGIPVAASFVRAGHLVDGGAPLVQALRLGRSPLARHLRETLGPVLEPGEPAEEPLRIALNRVLRADDLAAVLDDREAARIGDALDGADRLVWAAAPGGAGRVRRNRLVLEAGFPEAVRRAHAVVRVAAHGERRVIMNAVRRLQGSARPPLHLVVELCDSGLYVEPITIEVAEHHTVEIRAADGCRPTVTMPERSGDVDDLGFVCGPGSRVVLDGIMVSAEPVRVAGNPAEVVVRHCTLVPGWELDTACRPSHGGDPSLIITDLPRPRGRQAPGPTCVEIDHSIVGTVVVQRDEVLGDPIHLHLRTSVVDATVPDDNPADPEAEAVTAPNGRPAHAAVTVVDSTVVGTTNVHAIELAENSIFTGRVDVVRRQVGCLRFCSLPPDSRTPRRHACQPDLVRAAAADPDAEEQRVRPQFATLRYGLPGYLRLTDGTAAEIRGGADDGSEMGVYHDTHTLRRAASLRAAVQEHLPLGWTMTVEERS